MPVPLSIRFSSDLTFFTSFALLADNCTEQDMTRHCVWSDQARSKFKHTDGEHASEEFL